VAEHDDGGTEARTLASLQGQLEATGALVEELAHELAATRDDRDRLEGLVRDRDAATARLEHEVEHLRAVEADLRVVQQSETYRLARVLSWPIRAVKQWRSR